MKPKIPLGGIDIGTPNPCRKCGKPTLRQFGYCKECKPIRQRVCGEERGVKIVDRIEDYLLDHYETNFLCRFAIHITEIPNYLKYLFGKADNPDFCSKWERFKCRIKHHPCGSIYYACYPATEPDGRCKNCGDEIL